jgi:hypothetical protein
VIVRIKAKVLCQRTVKKVDYRKHGTRQDKKDAEGDCDDEGIPLTSEGVIYAVGEHDTQAIMWHWGPDPLDDTQETGKYQACGAFERVRE